MYRLYFFEATSLFSAFSENSLAFSQIFEFQNPLSGSKNIEKDSAQQKSKQMKPSDVDSGIGQAQVGFFFFFSIFRVFIFQTSQDKDDAVAARGQQTENQEAAKNSTSAGQN